MPRLLSLLAAACLLAACRHASPTAQEPWMNTPLLAVENLTAQNLFYNGVAQPWLAKHRPDLLRDDTRSASYAQATQLPKLFRQLDRQERFDALLLVGDPSQYRPLLDHLLEAQDWKLAQLDHVSLVFRRDLTAPWAPDHLQPLRDRLAKIDPATRAEIWSKVAVKLVAVRQFPAAKAIVEEAAAADSSVAEVWSAQATYRLALGDWKGALDSAQKALGLDRNSLSALGCMSQALFASKHFDEAYTFSSKLVAQVPEDPNLLFYHAKIAHEARHYGAEIDALRHVIELAEKSGVPVSGYRVYLGQALGMTGEGDDALQEFALALADPDLPPEQRKFANECVARLKERMGHQPH